MHFNFSIKLAAVMIGLTAMLLGTTLIASAKVRISERIKYYNVSGKTGKQLFRSINRKGPKTRRDGHAIATTAYTAKFENVKTTVRGRRCVVTSADLHVRITYTYPRWRNSKRATKKTRRNWKKFIARVVKHEKSHGRIYREYSRELHKIMRGLRGRTSRGCKDFGTSSKRALKFAERKLQRRHERLDSRDGWASSRIRRLQATLIRSR